MEILFILIGIITTWLVLLYLTEKEEPKDSKMIFLGFVIFWWAVTYGIFLAGNSFGETTITKRLDVLEYDRIVYSTPKTVIETEYKAPWWSNRDNSTYTVSD